MLRVPDGVAESIRGMHPHLKKKIRASLKILRCGDGSLYTGIAKDVQARVKQHSEGRGATYTRTRLPVKLLYQQESLTQSEPRCPSDEPSPYGPAAIFRKDQTNFRTFFRDTENFDLPVMFGDDPFGRG